MGFGDGKANYEMFYEDCIVFCRVDLDFVIITVPRLVCMYFFER